MNEISFVTYNKKHQDIVKSGINAMSDILNGTDVREKRSLLLCLDKYLDPYYGYDLPFFDDTILLLQKQLLKDKDKDVINDIFRLLTNYSKGSLDYLADNIEIIDPVFLASAIYALELTFNQKYAPIFRKFENHENPRVCAIAKEALLEISNLNNRNNE